MRLLITLFTVLILVSSCASQNPLVGQAPPDSLQPAGFLIGFWNGLIIYFAAIGKLFGANISLYNVYNTGGWYDFGFLLGLGLNVGATSAVNRNSK